MSDALNTIEENVRTAWKLPEWIDTKPAVARRRSVCPLGNNNSIVVETYDARPDQFYVCGHFCGVMISATAQTADFEEAKRMAMQLIVERWLAVSDALKAATASGV